MAIQDYNPIDTLAQLTGSSSAYPSFQQDYQQMTGQTPTIKAGEMPSVAPQAAFDLLTALAQNKTQQEDKIQQAKDLDFYRQNGYEKPEFDSGMGIAPLDPQSVKVEMLGGQRGIIAGKAPVTQPFGNRSRVEKYSGGVNLGADLGTPAGTKLAVPPVGEWEIVTAAPGFNNGSGNLVKARNTKTGEIVGFEHLSQISVRPGDKIQGGTVIGLSGGNQTGPGRGNSTGSHSSIIYINPQGQYQDIMRSPYARYLFGG